jgi:D-3-phosphoglycerate dehydrogenase / 2-oxoglutarate reductase
MRYFELERCFYVNSSLMILQSFYPGKWQRNKYVGVSLVGKTLAILGFGKVGSEVARRAKGLGMHVVAHDPYASADRARAIGVDLVSFEEAISTADFISLNMPLTPSTDKMLNDETFAKMKKGVRIINVARGGVIDEEALIQALDSGIVAQVRNGSGTGWESRMVAWLYYFYINFHVLPKDT